MVQLKETDANIDANTPYTFQFRYGAIKSGLFKPSLCHYHVISIPVWCN